MAMRDDGKRADGMLDVPRKLDRPLVWDATCVDRFLAPSHLSETQSMADTAAFPGEQQRRSRRCWIVSVVVLLVLACLGALVAVLVLRPWEDSDSRPLRFQHAAVAANGPECAAIGRSILEMDGSAVDAAIATLFCEGLACAQCMGLGGRFLATVYDAASGQVRVLNARERAPAATTQNMYENTTLTVGGLVVAVPGELRGYGDLYHEYGRLPWRDLVLPTARLAREGHRVSNYMARVLESFSDIIKAEPSMREVYLNEETGEVWQEGDLLVDTVLAHTLDVIAEEGPEAMYNGSLTATFVQDIRGHGGIVTEDDMRHYRTEWQEPISTPLTDDYTLFSAPLPGSGAILAFILNMLRGSTLGKTASSSASKSSMFSTAADSLLDSWPSGPVEFNSDIYWHRVLETFKYAYAKRSGLGDPNRYNVTHDIHELQRNLSDPFWAAEHRLLVDETQTFNDWRHYGALFDTIDDQGTGHVVVVAPDGSVVSATSTINAIWGCQRRSSSSGIILNDQMNNFAIPGRENVFGLPPSPANYPEPGLQPLSSMSPSIVFNEAKELKLAVGAAGGTRITTQVTLITRATVLEGIDLPTSMNLPRLHHQLLPMEVQHESEFDSNVLESLRSKGHETSEQGPTGFATVIAAMRDDDGYLVPLADHRRGGSIDGF